MGVKYVSRSMVLLRANALAAISFFVLFVLLSTYFYFSKNILVAIILFLTSLVPILALVAERSVNYRVAKNSIIVRKTPFHRKLFYFYNLEEIKKVTNNEAAAIITNKKNKTINYTSGQIATSLLGSGFINFPGFTIKVNSNKKEETTAQGEFVLITVSGREGKSQILLSPKNPDEFIEQVKGRILKESDRPL